MTRALCAAGCGRRVKGRKNHWCSPQCVPRSKRAENCRQGRKTFAYRRRAIFFRSVLERLTEGRRRVSTEAILDAFQAAYNRGYQNGYHAGRWPFVGRQSRAA